jgi:hypothetical protein
MSNKAKAAKMSMNDILFLFKRDAEHGAGGAADSLNVKTRILKERRPARVELVDTRERRYVSPQEEAEMEARKAREQTSIYARRW